MPNEKLKSAESYWSEWSCTPANDHAALLRVIRAAQSEAVAACAKVAEDRADVRARFTGGETKEERLRDYDMEHEARLVAAAIRELMPAAPSSIAEGAAE